VTNEPGQHNCESALEPTNFAGGTLGDFFFELLQQARRLLRRGVCYRFTGWVVHAKERSAASEIGVAIAVAKNPIVPEALKAPGLHVH